ncbi:MAG TPA: 30S ribosomal protein S17 [bacterium (Candidatus Stahlbacteria)]|nr:30S ribosomal protein S17 [Candidatus Stahlbacteria bacterium]
MKKRLKGKVISNKMNKTVMVSIERRVFHPLYKKIIRKRTKLACHDEHGIAKPGDEVLIEETRPISKTKHFRIVKVL